MNTFYETISTPVITDMDFAYSGSSDIVNTGYNTLFAGSDAIILARYPAGTRNVGSSIDAVTRTGSRSFDKTFPVVPRPDNSFVPKLWAHTKIRELMDRMVVEGETDALVSEITDLSLEFGFVTPYTSLFVEVPVTDKISEATTEAYEGAWEGEVADEAPVEAVTPVATATSALGGADAPVVAPTPEATSAPRVSEAPDEVSAAAEETATQKKTPGFSALFAIAGLAAVAYLARRR
jgi:PGF-CTERM protein